MTTKLRSVMALTGLGLVLGAASMGCASTPPPALLDARAAYQHASTSSAAELTPAQLHVAQQSLALAESTFEDEGDSDKTRDRAYVATRKAELAEAEARLVAIEKQNAEADKQASLDQQNKAAQTRDQLNMTKEQLAAQSQQMEAERAARADAERRAKEATDALARVAAVKQEPRGVVITLSGSVLFASGKSELLPAAQSKLNEVATVLAKQGDDKKIVVEGYTDSQGADAFNQTLSESRAASVRTYLTNHGVDSSKITSQGFGKGSPVADNASPEGRANNRRVEIVISPAAKASSTN